MGVAVGATFENGGTYGFYTGATAPKTVVDWSSPSAAYSGSRGLLINVTQPYANARDVDLKVERVEGGRGAGRGPLLLLQLKLAPYSATCHTGAQLAQRPCCPCWIGTLLATLLLAVTSSPPLSTLLPVQTPNPDVKAGIAYHFCFWARLGAGSPASAAVTSMIMQNGGSWAFIGSATLTVTRTWQRLCHANIRVNAPMSLYVSLILGATAAAYQLDDFSFE